MYLYIAINAHTYEEPWGFVNYSCLFNLLISDKDILKPLPNDRVCQFCKNVTSILLLYFEYL